MSAPKMHHKLSHYLLLLFGHRYLPFFLFRWALIAKQPTIWGRTWYPNERFANLCARIHRDNFIDKVL